jgi:hypothetical protein
MVGDFRSNRMETPEGKGKAKGRFERAWDSYARGVNSVTGQAGTKLAKSMGAATAVDLFGFWLTWQTEGGFEGLQRLGMSRSAIYRRIGLFRKFMGVHPDEYEMPGVTIDVQAYQIGTGIPAIRENREQALNEVERQVGLMAEDPERSSTP